MFLFSGMVMHALMCLLVVSVCSFVVNVRSIKDVKLWAVGPADQLKKRA